MGFTDTNADGLLKTLDTIKPIISIKSSDDLFLKIEENKQCIIGLEQKMEQVLQLLTKINEKKTF
ncbi:hypothetical protein [Candidatus Nitrosocosmicus hydrocola]|jgi:hypothetical protein|uniref:hypothetical protein n=1 Tax=Candidatus Nitrosocosmicus hydrocola TaxID=1826872 RepID=UPI0011E60742|nr:hypothetical protein [Candidatus Nitrosocosmicus hydrocola]